MSESAVVDTSNPEASGTSTSTATAQTEPGESTAVEYTDTFFLRFSRDCRPFKNPDYPEIALIAQNHFKDPAMNCTYFYNKSEIIYRMETTQQHSTIQALKFTVEGKEYTIELEPFIRYSGKRPNVRTDDGLLLTFYKAGIKSLDGISNKEFDKIIENELGLTLNKPTVKQYIYKTTIYNGNRFCVVEQPDNLAKIPDSMPITNRSTGKVHHIQIQYNGQLRYCSRCLDRHGRVCPELKEFYEARDERRRMERDNEIKIKIMSDSTLRRADTIGLKADVLCMSGGGVGQVAQAAMDDPDAVGKDIVLVAGANDIKCSAFKNEHEYAQSINHTMEKVLALADQDTSRKVIIVRGKPSDKVEEQLPFYTDEQINQHIREVYLHRRVENLVKEAHEQNADSNLHMADVEYEKRYPSPEGTMQILQQIHNLELIQKELIWNQKFIVHDRLYKGVQPIFRYGCSHCHDFGKTITHEKYKNPIVCDNCMELVVLNTMPNQNELLLEIKKSTEKIIEESKRNKRALDDNEENESKKIRAGENGEAPEESDDSSSTVVDMDTQE